MKFSREYTSEALMCGCALVALHGLIRERVTFVRHWSKDKDIDWSKDAQLNHLRACCDAVRLGKPFDTVNTDITDALAHAYQTCRVDLADWEQVVKVRFF